MSHPIVALRRAAVLLNGGTPTPAETNWGGGVPWATPVDLGANHGSWLSTTLRTLTKVGVETGSAVAPARSVLLSTRAPIGYVAINEVPMAFNQGCKAAIPRHGVDARFLSYALVQAGDQMSLLGQGSTFLELSTSALASIRISLPSEQTEQRQIAEYLDRETRQIDVLVTKQEQLVEALTERRQAVIAHAVTRGLDPLIELKDSATKWWGKIPVHWSISGLKHLVSIPITDGPHETPTFLDDGIEFISASAISDGFVNFDKRRGYISAEDHALYSMKYSPRLHDILMIKSGATTGISAILTEDRDFSIWSPLAALRSNSRANPFFVHFAIQSQAFQRALALAWTFGTQQNIGMSSIGDLQIPIPPKSEQDQIALNIQERTSKIDALSAKALEVIEVLKERRQSLISAAVTGKIDVRGL